MALTEFFIVQIALQSGIEGQSGIAPTAALHSAHPKF